jgi:hypothetical protein
MMPMASKISQIVACAVNPAAETGVTGAISATGNAVTPDTSTHAAVVRPTGRCQRRVLRKANVIGNSSNASAPVTIWTGKISGIISTLTARLSGNSSFQNADDNAFAEA